MYEDKSSKPTYRELVALVAELRAHIAKQDLRITKLEAQLAAAKKTSRNSSKPPSSDIVKPQATSKKPGKKKKRHIGGQHGHPKHESKLSLDNADHIVEFKAESFDDCRNLVPAPDAEPKIIFQYELVERPVELPPISLSHIWIKRQDRSSIRRSREKSKWPDSLDRA